MKITSFLTLTCALSLAACNTAATKNSADDGTVEIIRLVGDQVTEVLTGTSFTVDGNFGPFGKDIERTVILWGIEPIDTLDTSYYSATDALKEWLIDTAMGVACIEQEQNSKGESIANCHMGKKSIQEELLMKKLVTERCDITQNQFGTCQNNL